MDNHREMCQLLRPFHNGVSSEISRNKVHLLKGKNGSGKTTLLRAIAGLIKPTNGEIIWENVQKMNEEHAYVDKEGVKWQRVWQTPNTMIDSDIDPFSQEQWNNKTKDGKGSVGDLWDRSRELSEKRKKVLGHDPIKDKYFRDYSKKRRGLKHSKDPGKSP